MGRGSQPRAWALLCSLLVVLDGCGGDSGVEGAAEVGACQDVAADPEVAGDGAPAELIRARRTTERGLARWLATRNGPDGPSQTPPPGAADPDATVDVCVFRSEVPRSISVPPGSTIDTTGVEVFVRSGVVTLAAIGDAARLARGLDGFP